MCEGVTVERRDVPDRRHHLQVLLEDDVVVRLAVLVVEGEFGVLHRTQANEEGRSDVLLGGKGLDLGPPVPAVLQPRDELPGGVDFLIIHVRPDGWGLQKHTGRHSSGP